MKSFEALYKLDNPEKLSYEEYAEAIREIIYNCKVIASHLNTEIFGHMYLNDNKLIAVTSGLCPHSNIIIDSFLLEDAFNDAAEFKYEHWFGPGLANEYDIPKYYSSFSDFVSSIVVSESDEYFLDERSFAFSPAFEKNDAYTWLVHVTVGEGYDKNTYVCGRLTVS